MSQLRISTDGRNYEKYRLTITEEGQAGASYFVEAVGNLKGQQVTLRFIFQSTDEYRLFCERKQYCRCYAALPAYKDMQQVFVAGF